MARQHDRTRGKVEIMALTHCPDCSGPIVRAFASTTNYVTCTRCGHVQPAEMEG